MKARNRSVIVVTVMLLCLLITASGAALARPGNAPVPAPTPAVTMTADGVVRAWPSSSSEALGTIPARSTVPVIGRTVDFTWWQIAFSSGQNGYAWLAATVVLPNGTAASVPIIQVIQPTPTPVTPTPVPTPSTCTLDAAFVTDVTVPDGTVLTPTQAVNKVWRLRNTGTCAWDDGTVLKFVSGFQLGAPSQVAIPSTTPGNTVDVAATMYAPPDFGRFVGVWQLQDGGVNFFGPKMTVVVNVNDPNPPTPVPPPPPPGPAPTPKQPKAVKIDFWADSTKINGGKCTTVHWNVSNATRVEFNDGKWRGVGGKDSRKECPGSNTTYRLRVVDQRGQTHDRSVKISVNFKPVPNPNPYDPMPGPVPNPNPDDD